MQLISRSVREIDHQETGRLMRKYRERLGVSLRGAAFRIGISHVQLCRLELGQKKWSAKLHAKVNKIYSVILHKNSR